MPTTLLSFTWHCFKGHKSTFIYLIVLSLAAGFWGPLNSLLIKKLLNHMTLGNHVTFEPFLLALNFIIFDNVTWRGIDYLKYKNLPIILNHIDTAILNHTLQHSHQFFQERMAGSLAKQIFRLIDSMESFVSNIIPNILRQTSLLLIAFIFTYSVHPVFFYILLIWSVIFVVMSLYMSQQLSTLSIELSAIESTLGGQIIDSLTHAFSITIFARRHYELTRRKPYIEEYTHRYVNRGRYQTTLSTVQGGLIAIMMLCVIYYLVRLYNSQSITLGDFALIVGLSMEVGHMMWFTMSQVADLIKMIGRCTEAFNAVMLPPLEIIDNPHAPPLVCTEGNIKVENVSFHYKGTDKIFKNFSVEILPGQKVGLVGSSGAGKSTFVNLILRLYDVTDGHILIDNQNIQDVTQNSLHESIAFIPQDPALFHRSLLDNIRYGQLEATDDEVIEAAQKAHAHKFIEMLPQGYHTLVGERGIRLSGGQRQRIAIARAILKNAPILILDEATSQLDSITENIIQETLTSLMQQKTTIVIAHRLSTLLKMDRILVFEKGRIVEDGSHTELLAKSTIYKKLWNAQVGGFLVTA